MLNWQRKALEANMHVFVEKPLALNDEQLERCLQAAAIQVARLMVGSIVAFHLSRERAQEFFAVARHRFDSLSR